MSRVGTHIVTDVPAAFALGVLQRRGIDLLVVIAHDLGSRDDEDELQVAAQRSQGIEFVAGTADFDGGLQGRADLAGFALGRPCAAAVTL